MATTEELLFVLKMQDQASSIMAGFARTITTTGTAAKETKAGLGELAGAVGAVGVAFGALAAGNAAFRATLGTFREYELGIANIQKVSGIGGDAVRDFSARFDELARRIPVSVEKLQEMAYTAGSLGVQGSTNILAITEAMAKLGTTTNVTGEKGTLAVTQLLNIMHEAPTEAGRLASQLVSLDNVTSASAMSILQMGKEVGLATNFFRIGSGEALAIGASLAGLGVRAERGGTAVGRVFTALDQATRGTLPKGLKDLEVLFGATTAQLREMETADPTAFFVRFIQKLGDVKADGGNYYTLLKNLGLGQRETASSILPLADHADLLASKLRRVAVEGRTVTAQDREFDIFLRTLDSQMKLAGNSMQLFEKDLGAAVGGPAKASVTAFAGAINFLDSMFTSLDPRVQQFIVGETLLATTVLGAAVAVRSLVSVIELLNVASLVNPWTVAAAAIASAAVAYVSLSGATRDNIELTQDETTKLAQLARGGDDAAVAMENLTRAQASNLKFAISQKIEDTNAKLAELAPLLRSGQNEFQRLAMTGNLFARTSFQELDQLNQAWRAGTLAEDQYKVQLELLSRSSDPMLAAQATRVRVLVSQWDEATAAKKRYDETAARIGDPANYSKNGQQYGPPRPDAPIDTAALDALDARKARKTGGGNKAQETADFLREVQEKEAGYARETAALNVSTEAYNRQQKVERENAEVDAVLKRGLDLKVASINQMAAAYRTALEARDSAQARADAKDVTDQVEEKIAAFEKEDAALKQGALAYERYKLAAKVDPEVEAFTRKLESLGMEADAVDKLAQKYRDAAAAHETATVAAEKDAAKQKESADLAKSVASQFSSAAEGILLEGKSFDQTALTFAKSITKMVVETALLKPIEAELSSFFNSIVTPGSDSKANSLGVGGLFSGLFGAIGLGGLFGGTAAAGAGTMATAAASGIDAGLGGLYHRGGVVDERHQASRRVPAGTFDRAPRYHTGLGNDEFAAILQRGERVMTAAQNNQTSATVAGLSNQVSQLARRGARPAANVTFNVSTPNADSFQASQSQLFAKAQVQMTMALRRNG